MQRILVLIILLLLPALVAGYFYENSQSKDYGINSVQPAALTPEREDHILYGDARGGGHKFGVGKPCKSEFPQGWSDEQILGITRQIAANDNLDWRQERNGYYVAEDRIDSVNVRVVVNREKGEIITSYPINLPRNPCPAAANDNRP